jgi:hypothetical protein
VRDFHGMKAVLSLWDERANIVCNLIIWKGNVLHRHPSHISDKCLTFRDAKMILPQYFSEPPR